MNDTEGKFSLPSSISIISPLPLSYSPVISIPLCWPWTRTCTHTRSLFSFMVSFVFLRLSLPVSVTLSPSFSSLHSPLPPRNGFRWANFISVMPLVCNSQFGFSGKWPPLFIEALFIWTTWLLCPNPEITFGWLWKGWCVSVIPYRLFLPDWHFCLVAMVLFGSRQEWRATRLIMKMGLVEATLGDSTWAACWVTMRTKMSMKGISVESQGWGHCVYLAWVQRGFEHPHSSKCFQKVSHTIQQMKESSETEKVHRAPEQLCEQKLRRNSDLS